MKGMLSGKLFPTVYPTRLTYLPPPNDPNKLTLVLDLDETLTHHFAVNQQFKQRLHQEEPLCSVQELMISQLKCQNYTNW